MTDTVRKDAVPAGHDDEVVPKNFQLHTGLNDKVREFLDKAKCGDNLWFNPPSNATIDFIQVNRPVQEELEAALVANTNHPNFVVATALMDQLYRTQGEELVTWKLALPIPPRDLLARPVLTPPWAFLIQAPLGDNCGAGVPILINNSTMNYLHTPNSYGMAVVNRGCIKDMHTTRFFYNSPTSSQGNQELMAFGGGVFVHQGLDTSLYVESAKLHTGQMCSDWHHGTIVNLGPGTLYITTGTFEQVVDLVISLGPVRVKEGIHVRKFLLPKHNGSVHIYLQNVKERMSQPVIDCVKYLRSMYANASNPRRKFESDLELCLQEDAS